MHRTTSRLRPAFTVLLLGLAAAVLPLQAQPVPDEAPRLTLEAIHASDTFTPTPFRGGRWAEEGPVLLFIEPGDEQGTTDLLSYDLQSGQRTRLIDGANLVASDVGRPIAIEEYAYGPNGTKVLIYTDSERVWRRNTKGYYYLYDQTTRSLTPLSDRDEGFQMFAKLSPDGTKVAFVRDRNLFLVDPATGEETQLTDDGAPGGVINGTTDWVYEEEFGLRDAWAWSPDSRYIAFLQLDETETRDFVMADLREQYPVLEEFRYPKAGEANSEARVGVIDVTSGDIAYFNTDTWQAGGDTHEYIPRLGWTPALDGTHYVWMYRLNRNQNALDLLYGAPDGMEVTTALQETADAWIDIDDEKLTYLDDGAHFVWISEEDGYRHLYLHRNDGTRVGRLTEGAWEVTELDGIDQEAGLVYFTATKKSPLERHLYRVPLRTDGAAGAESPQIAEPEQITERAGTHSINLSGDRKYYIDAYSSATTPLQVSLHGADGTELRMLEANAALQETLAAYKPPAPEFTTVPGADGTELNASLIKPSDFDPEQTYPLLMYVYGGPGSQTVVDGWGGSRYLWHAYLADELGVIVASVDNRGTGGRGAAFKNAPYKQLGVLEARDQIAAARHLGALPYIDEERMGIWGWSYGGYMTLMALLTGDGPETFSVGLSVAPVADWRQYDTIYTERYMSTPQQNPEGYRSGSPIAYADRLRKEQDLILVHGDLDDNVHFQNAVQMVDALQSAGKQFAFMVYPGRNHSIAGGTTRLHLFTLLTNFVRDNLLPEGVSLNVITR